MYAIAYSGSAGYAGGTFQNAGGNGNADFLARWNGANWAPACGGSALNGNVKALQIIGQTLYVGGEFQDGAGIDSADLPARLRPGHRGAELDGRQSRSSVLRPVYSLTADANGVLYAGGGFTNLQDMPAADNVAYVAGGLWHLMGSGGGGIPQADHIAKWNGSAWSAVGANSSGTDGWFPDGTSLHGMTSFLGFLFVTGEFSNAGGDPRADRIAIFDGQDWRPVGSDGANDGPLPQTGLALAVFNNADEPRYRHLIAGGNFTSAGGDTQARGSRASRCCTCSRSPPPTPPPYTPPPPTGSARSSGSPSPKAPRCASPCSDPTVGRKVAGTCVKAKGANRFRPSCTRWVTVQGSYTAAGRRGRTRGRSAPDGRQVAAAWRLPAADAGNRRGRQRLGVQDVAVHHRPLTPRASLGRSGDGTV